jgi:hypothetical protein
MKYSLLKRPAASNIVADSGMIGGEVMWTVSFGHKGRGVA